MKQLITIFLFLLFSLSAFGQNQYFTLYQYDKKIINPAFTGLENYQSFSTIFSGVSRIIGISYENQFSVINSGASLFYLNDHLGPYSQRLLKLKYNYQIRIAESQRINIGTGVNFLSNIIDFSAYQPVSPDDPLIRSGYLHHKNVDLDFGISYSTHKFLAGISVKNLLKSKNMSFDNYDYFNTQYLNAFISHRISVGKVLDLTPSVYYLTDYDGYQLDVNLSSKWYDIVVLGISCDPHTFGDLNIVSLNAGLTWKDKVQLYSLIYTSMDTGNDQYYEFALRVNIAND